jgi:ribulose-phosphate 3-epimerase
MIRNSDMEVGISIKPKTEITKDLLELIDNRKVDKVLVMTVEPGFGGQKFMESMMHKVKSLRDAYEWLDIQVDGGISLDTIGIAAKSGANSFVAGSAIFGAKDKKETIEKMKQIVADTQ